jgi:hypothetical protein
MRRYNGSNIHILNAFCEVRVSKFSKGLDYMYEKSQELSFFKNTWH